ncbi:GTP binding domain [Trypanosoma melophagium]|uniref:GTP binding domain n=1 Tax=Trypanosoma melophagium TaxID=715481 RepID=UPI00351A9678|nr:GTP binding domain [Trypanosoma melophagium]
MSCRNSGRQLFSLSGIVRRARFFHKTPVGLNPGKIIIPKLPSLQGSGDAPTNLSLLSSSSSSISSPYKRKSEYRENMQLNPEVSQFLGGDSANTLRQQVQLEKFRRATEGAAVKVWRESKSHLRQQEKLVKEIGVEGAVREVLQPTRTSFRQELRRRPLDRGILEEIYKGLHGKRIERKLKKGVSWEHWITKGDGTAPVFNASQKAQQTFAFGGSIKLVVKATHAKQFPVLYSGGKRGDSRVKVEGTQPILVPEVAFIGRTSSGKSSLINAIVNAMIAPYGHLQGTTSSVNFYNVANRIVLVDCPGYGYFNPMETPTGDAENAVAVTHDYLRSCSAHGNTKGKDKMKRGDVGSHSLGQIRPIKRVFVCVSSRGLQHTDIAYLDRLEELSLPFSVILTKTDAAPIRFLARLTDHTRSKLVHYKHCKELMLASSLRLAGIDKIQNLIGAMALGEDKLHGATTDFSSIV